MHSDNEEAKAFAALVKNEIGGPFALSQDEYTAINNRKRHEAMVAQNKLVNSVDILPLSERIVKFNNDDILNDKELKEPTLKPPENCIYDTYIVEGYIKQKPGEKIYYKKPYIDMSVYSPTQQFRLIGSRKYDSDRVKRMMDEWFYRGNLIKHKYSGNVSTNGKKFIIQMQETLIVIANSGKILPAFGNKTKIINKEYKKYGEKNIDDKSVDEIESLIRSKLDGAFSISKVDDGLIHLKRNHESFCKLCGRVHENENSFITISDNGGVYWNCFRKGNGPGLLIGNLGSNPCIPEDDNESFGLLAPPQFFPEIVNKKLITSPKAVSTPLPSISTLMNFKIEKQKPVISERPRCVNVLAGLSGIEKMLEMTQKTDDILMLTRNKPIKPKDEDDGDY